MASLATASSLRVLKKTFEALEYGYLVVWEASRKHIDISPAFSRRCAGYLIENAIFFCVCFQNTISPVRNCFAGMLCVVGIPSAWSSIRTIGQLFHLFQSRTGHLRMSSLLVIYVSWCTSINHKMQTGKGRALQSLFLS